MRDVTPEEKAVIFVHVDDYLDGPNPDPIAKEFLEHARRPAIEQDKDWLRANAPTVTWQGERYHCVGASRMGDVWLKNRSDNSRPNAYYDHRVNIADLSDWQRPALRTGAAHDD